MTTKEILSAATEKMEKAINSMKKEFANVRTGRANPLILERVMVEYYGTPTPLRQMSNVTVQDGQTLVITPYDKTILNEIEDVDLGDDDSDNLDVEDMGEDLNNTETGIKRKISISDKNNIHVKDKFSKNIMKEKPNIKEKENIKKIHHSNQLINRANSK